LSISSTKFLRKNCVSNDNKALRLIILFISIKEGL
jgi:hypothetical protein